LAVTAVGRWLLDRDVILLLTFAQTVSPSPVTCALTHSSPTRLRSPTTAKTRITAVQAQRSSPSVPPAGRTGRIGRNSATGAGLGLGEGWANGGEQFSLYAP